MYQTAKSKQKSLTRYLVISSVSENSTFSPVLPVSEKPIAFFRIVIPYCVELTISSIYGFWSTSGTLTRSDVVFEVILVVVIHVVVGVVVVVAGSAHVITCQ